MRHLQKGLFRRTAKASWECWHVNIITPNILIMLISKLHISISKLHMTLVNVAFSLISISHAQKHHVFFFARYQGGRRLYQDQWSSETGHRCQETHGHTADPFMRPVMASLLWGNCRDGSLSQCPTFKNLGGLSTYLVPKGSMGLVYLPRFAIKINQM